MTAPAKVLLIEDNEGDQYIAKRVLRDEWPDTQVLVATNGQEAIDILDKWYEEPPSLILLDINMPGMDGHDFLDSWYRNHNYENPVVAMLTSSLQPKDKDRATQYRCVREYLTKPLSREALQKLRLS